MQNDQIITRRDFAIGTGIALVMAAVFVWLSPGRALLVTFIPGIFAAWALFAYLFRRQQPLPQFDDFVPWYLVTLAVQFLHFSEEFTAGFQDRFGLIYGGGELQNYIFVIINMISYFVFLIAPLAVYYLGRRFLLVPMLFFIVYGALGNAIAHTYWSIAAWGYFPGLFTAQLYWFFGPFVLRRLGLSRTQVAGFVVIWAAFLLVFAGGFLDVEALRALK